MGELAISRNRGPAVRYRAVLHAEKPAEGTRRQSAARPAAFTVSETLRQLLNRAGQAETHMRENRRALRTGESALAEVQDSLGRMAELVQKSIGGKADPSALQEELDQLREKINRIANNAVIGDVHLFLDGDGIADSLEPLLHVFEGEVAAGQGALQTLPGWLTAAIAQNAFTAEELLSALGVQGTAGGPELLAAIVGTSLESSDAAGYLAALYLGAVIAGGALSGTVDPARAIEGLRQLLEKTAEGIPADQAIETLTNGTFTGMEDFQSQFIGGIAPGLQEFLSDLLLSGGVSALVPESPLLSLLAEAGSLGPDLIMGLLTALQNPSACQKTTADTALPLHVSVLQLGNVQVVGGDLSGVALDASASQLTVGGTEDVAILGGGQKAPAILVIGSGTVTLQNVNAPALAIHTAEARVFNTGESTVDELLLRQGASLTLDGRGPLRIGALRADRSNVLRLTGGAAIIGKGCSPSELPAISVLLDGPALLSAPVASVSSSGGKPLAPLDIIWKTLLPGWSSITSIEVDGRQSKTALLSGTPARLWLDPSHGSPAHTLVIQGRDGEGRFKTRYAYLHWNQNTGAFEEISLYPNPFSVTGGEPGRDWVYEEASHTLYILSGLVCTVSGGSGTGPSREPFSGRIALADGIGPIELTLDGVDCRVPCGRAFSLGRENRVTLLLQNGTDNLFESGAGCAGISLGAGTSLRIDCALSRRSSGAAAGTLTAAGGDGGAGIGRDMDGGREQTSRIVICGGVITASGDGGAAGIGAGRHGAMGPITVIGGTVTAVGRTQGGAGIGGALGAQAGDISIRGGRIYAEAARHAAAIGAGVQGACGNILITGTAQIVKAAGGSPDADIGACPSGVCGKVQVSGGADIGCAKLKTWAGISLRMGADVAALPQFPLSSGALKLDGLRVTTRESAEASLRAIDAGRSQVARIQTAYGTLYSRLEQSLTGLRRICRYIDAAGGPVRDTAAAGALLKSTAHSIPLQSRQAMGAHDEQNTDSVRQLLE